MNFLKKNWSNILLILVIVLMIIPQTRKPVQVGLNRLIAFSPSKVIEENRETVDSYDWRLKQVNGGITNFNRSKEKVAIINLWATWCPPCIAEMPSFQKLYKDYGNKVDFYFISTEEEDKLQRFLKRKDYDFPVFQPLSAGPEKFQSRSLPTTFVLSKEGEIVVKTTGSANWNDGSFRELLNELIEEEP